LSGCKVCDESALAEQRVGVVLEGVGENPAREGLLDTPARVVRMYEEVFAGK
jgi:GTP cyclohydrolase I